jgi:hypothetical protein
MQDTLVMLIERGHDPDWVLGLDMCQFEALADSSNRIDARRRIESISDSRQVAHADGKAMEKYLKPLKAASKLQSASSVERDADALLKAQR